MRSATIRCAARASSSSSQPSPSSRLARTAALGEGDSTPRARRRDGAAFQPASNASMNRKVATSRAITSSVARSA